MTQSVDVFLADYDFFYSLGEFDYLADIREYLPEDLLEKYKEDFVYVKEYGDRQKISDWHKTER